MFSLLSECDKPILNFSNRNFVSKLPIYAMPTLSRFWNPSFTWPFYSTISMFLFLVYLTNKSSLSSLYNPSNHTFIHPSVRPIFSYPLILENISDLNYLYHSCMHINDCVTKILANNSTTRINHTPPPKTKKIQKYSIQHPDAPFPWSPSPL